MRNTLIVLAVLTLAAAAMAYDPPEVIGYIEASDEDRGRFAPDFCCVGDQNGDGCNDLLVSNNPYSYHWGGDHTNRVELYYGGEEVDDEYDMAFTTEVDMEGIGFHLSYLRSLSEDLAYCFVMGAAQFEIGNEEGAFSQSFYLYSGGDHLDNEAELRWTTSYEFARHMGKGRDKRPTDLNDDGWDDFITTRYIDGMAVSLIIYLGGEEFDTIPDWSVYYPNRPINMSTGYDVNGDGYDDMMVKSYQFHVYLGGEDMDTIPAVAITRYFDVDDVTVSMGNFSLLPDVNDDGYDDWGAYYREGNENGIRSEGYFIWFGSEEPDDEYDLVLEGHGFLADYGDLTGGDFNGDGVGDIATCSWCANHFQGDIHIYFGSRWIDGEADININPYREYGREYEGLVP